MKHSKFAANFLLLSLSAAIFTNTPIQAQSPETPATPKTEETAPAADTSSKTTKESLADYLPITERFIPQSVKQRPGISMTPQYITIHNTGNSDPHSDANMHDEYLRSESAANRQVSWHFTVDDSQILQHIPVSEAAYHAGDSAGDGNMASIGIEICENSDGDYLKSEKNAETLTAILLYENNLSIDRVVTHKHWSGKQCPHLLLDDSSISEGWDTFIKNVEEKLNLLKTPQTTPEPENTRKTPSTSETDKTDSEKPESDPQKESSTNPENTATTPEIPKEIQQAAETVDMLNSPLIISKDSTDQLMIYQPNVRVDYSLDSGKSEMISPRLQGEAVLNPDSYIYYKQAVSVVESDYEILDSLSEFEERLNDPETIIEASESFWDQDSRIFIMDGISQMKMTSEKGSVLFQVQNYLNNQAIISSNMEAKVNGWLQNQEIPERITTTDAQDAAESIEDGSDLCLEILRLGTKRRSEKEFMEESEGEVAEKVSVRFVSHNPLIASIDDDGTIHAKDKGVTMISVLMDNGITICRTVEVR